MAWMAHRKLSILSRASLILLDDFLHVKYLNLASEDIVGRNLVDFFLALIRSQVDCCEARKFLGGKS
jgi:hypothetical protein